ncbi:hypothetical protein ACVME8_007685 [Bradyrhizobium diazoefficiens]
MQRVQNATSPGGRPSIERETLDDERLIGQPAAAKLLGVTVRTIHRYRTNPAMNFPASQERNGRRYFRPSTLLAWEPPPKPPAPASKPKPKNTEMRASARKRG